MTDWWLLTPLLSAFLGWVIVKLLVNGFFHPSRPKKILRFSLHGVLIRRKQEISADLAKLAGKESFKSLEHKIFSDTNFQKIVPEIEVHIDYFLAVKLKEKMPMVGMFVGERTLAQLKEVFMEELQTLFPVIMRSYVAGLERDFNLEQIIAEKLQSIPDDKISAYFTQVTARHLNFLPLTGALFGFAIGAIQILIILIFNR